MTTTFNHSIPLRRSLQDRKIAGVCSGIARHFDIDPNLVRVGAVVATLFSGVPALAYALTWLLVDEDTTF